MVPSYFPSGHLQADFHSDRAGFYPNVDEEMNVATGSNPAQMMATYAPDSQADFTHDAAQRHYGRSGGNHGEFMEQHYGGPRMEWPQDATAQNVADTMQPTGMSREDVPTIVEQTRGFSIHNMSEDGRRFLMGFVEGRVSSKNVPAEFLRRFGNACLWAANHLHANADGATTEIDTSMPSGYEEGHQMWTYNNHVLDPSTYPSRAGANLAAHAPVAGSSNLQPVHFQERLTVQTNFPYPQGNSAARSHHRSPTEQHQFRTMSRGSGTSSPSRSPVSATSSFGDESHLDALYPSSPNSSTSSIGETTTCRWDGCMQTIEGSRPSHIAKHLKEVHFQGIWQDHSRGQCKWSGCTLVQPLFHSSFGKHIASTHLRNTKVECEYCGRTYSRGDSMNRHISSHHSEAAHLQ